MRTKRSCDVHKGNYLKVSVTELKFMRAKPRYVDKLRPLGEAGSCTMLLDLRKQTTKPLQCQDCDIDVQFLASVRFRRVFRSTITKRKFFLCPNCGRLSSAVVAIYQPHRSVAMPGSFRWPEITPRPHLTHYRRACSRSLLSP